MLEQLYGGLRRIPFGLEDRRYKFHKGISGLHSLPNSVEEFYALACCDEVHLDYRNFIFSAARSLVHMFDCKDAALNNVFFPSENFFDMEESKGIADKEKVSLFDTTIRARILRNRLYGNMTESQRTKKSDRLIPIFNEAMDFYMKNLLPEIVKICKMSADHWESKRPEYIKDFSKKFRSSTPTG